MYRFGVFLFIHDHCRGWWKASPDSQVSRRLFANSKGKLRTLACGSDLELPSGSYSIPDCELLHTGVSYPLANPSAAIRLNSRYCLDCVPIPYKLLRTGINISTILTCDLCSDPSAPSSRTRLAADSFAKSLPLFTSRLRT